MKEQKYIYIVSEDCHGDVSYWTDKEAAIEELWNIFLTIADSSDFTGVNKEETRKELEETECIDGIGCVYEKELNNSWL